MIHIQPNNKYPIPDNFAVEKAVTPMSELEVAENTASLMKEHSQPIDITEEDQLQAAKTIQKFSKRCYAYHAYATCCNISFKWVC